MILNEKAINKVVELIILYNFDTKIIFIQLYLKKRYFFVLCLFLGVGHIISENWFLVMTGVFDAPSLFLGVLHNTHDGISP